MNFNLLKTIALWIAILTSGTISYAQSGLETYFKWNASDGDLVGGSITGNHRDKEVTDDKGNVTLYKVIDLNETDGHEAIVKLDEPLKKGDVVSIDGFYYTGKEISDQAKVVIEIAGNSYALTGFNNIYQNGMLPEPRQITLGGECAGSTEFVIKSHALTSLTFWMTGVEVSHDPNVKTYLSVTPKADSQIDYFREYDSKITVTTNFNADRIRFSITDDDDNSVMYKSTMQLRGDPEDGVYTFSHEFTENVYFYQGHTYDVVFQANENDEDVGDPFTVRYFGTTPLPYSDVALMSQIPAPEVAITSASDNKVSLQFSDEANVSKVTLLYGETSLDVAEADYKAADDTKNIWVVTVPEQVINDYLAFSLKVEAKDAQGRIIGGDESKDYVTATFKCNVPKLLTVSPASDVEYDELTSFVLSYEGGIELIDEQAAITLTKEDKEYAGALTKVGGSYVFALDTPVTLAGTYSLSIPASMFSLGIGFDNEAMTVEYTVRKKEYDAEVKFYNIDGKTSPLNNLGSFVIDFKKGGYKAGYVNDRTLYSSPIVLVDADDEEVAKASSYDIVENTASFRFDFNKDIYRAGLYYLVVPKNVFWLSRDINNLSYIPNDDMIFEVTIEKSEDPEVDFGPITITPENGSRVNTLSRTVIRFEKAFSVSVAPGAETEYDVYEVEDGAPADAVASKAVLKKYITPDGMDLDGRINMSLCFEPAITKAGTYTTTIPANNLYITYTTGLKLYFDRDWTFTYTVDPKAGIEDIYLPVDPSELDEDSLVRVYNLQGILVREGRLKEALDGLHGLYIVNGFKLFIK